MESWFHGVYLVRAFSTAAKAQMKQLVSYIPNAMTIARLFLAFAFPFIPESWRIPVFVIAAVTEFMDGFLARKLDVVSKFGRLLDPVADKAFVFAMLVVFLLEGYVALWEVLVIGVRDYVITLGAAWVYFFGDRSDFDVATARWPGKIATNFQFAFLLSALILKEVHVALTVATALISTYAAYDYFQHWRKEVRPLAG